MTSPIFFARLRRTPEQWRMGGWRRSGRVGSPQAENLPNLEPSMSRASFFRRLIGSARRPDSKPVRRSRLMVQEMEDRTVPTGAVTEFGAGISYGSGPSGITAGPDGNLWFTESYGLAIGRITPQGVVTEFSASGDSAGIAAGPDGNLWFTEYYGNKIGRITPKGVVSAVSARTCAGSEQAGMRT